MSELNRNSTSGATANSNGAINKSSGHQRSSQSNADSQKFKHEDHDDRHPDQQQQMTAQQEPVKFGTDSDGTDPAGENSYAGGRRVTIGGLHNASTNNSTPNDKASSANGANHNGNLTNPSLSNGGGGSNSLPHHQMTQSNALQGLHGPGGFGGGAMMDRRGSMNSLGMDDFFGSFGGLNSRRGSMAGFDALGGGVDSLFGPMGLRRDSMDSTTATLDAAFMDLHRRRYSMGLPPFPQDNAGLPSLGGGGSAAGAGLGSFGGLQGSQGGGGTGADALSSLSQRGTGSPHDSIAARQAHLQAQQRELERKQKQLELERQRLVENIRQRNYGVGGGVGGNAMPNDRNRLALLEMENMNMNRRPSLPYTSGDGGMGGASGPGMGASTHSHLTSVSLDQSSRSHNTHNSYYPQQGMDGSMGSGHRGGGASKNWHICHFCNSRAFSSLDEAMAHETVCVENPTRNNFLGGGGGGFGGQNSHGGGIGNTYLGPHPGNPGNNGIFDRRQHNLGSNDNMMHPPLHHHGEGPSRNFSIGMDTSQRSTLSLGMAGGMLDGPIGRGLSIGMGSIGGGMDVSQRSALSMSTGLDASQRSDASLDRSNHSFIESALSNGPFTMLHQPMPLAMDCDKDWLTPLHCFVRRHCVEVFTATDDDVATPSKGKRKPIHVGQIGIRCPHCHRLGANSSSSKARERGSVYYPTTIKSIYNATMNLLQRHLHSCPAVPEDIMRRYETLKADDARSGTSKRYWEESALSLGLVDTHNGIRFSALRPPPLPTLTLQQETTGQSPARRNSNEFFSTKSNAVPDSRGGDCDAGISSDSKRRREEGSEYGDADASSLSKAKRNSNDTAPLVTPEDKPYSTLFSYHLLGQMQPCVFTEADRLGKRKGLPPGFPGLACRHCFGGYGSGRFFPSSIKTLSDTSKTLNVLHNHMMRCRKCPAEVRETLDKLRGSHDEERAKMKFGSQKAFFARIWERLHGKGFPGALKRSMPQQESRSPPPRDQLHHNQHVGMMGQQHLHQNHRQDGYGQMTSMQHHDAHTQHSSHQRTPLKQQQYRSPKEHARHPIQAVGNEGLEALAAATSPSKRQKLQ